MRAAAWMRSRSSAAMGSDRIGESNVARAGETIDLLTARLKSALVRRSPSKFDRQLPQIQPMAVFERYLAQCVLFCMMMGTEADNPSV